MVRAAKDRAPTGTNAALFTPELVPAFHSKEGGVVAKQLGATHYDEALQKVLRSDWTQQMTRLRSNFATEVLGLILHDQSGGL